MKILAFFNFFVLTFQTMICQINYFYVFVDAISGIHRSKAFKWGWGLLIMLEKVLGNLVLKGLNNMSVSHIIHDALLTFRFIFLVLSLR